MLEGWFHRACLDVGNLHRTRTISIVVDDAVVHHLTGTVPKEIRSHAELQEWGRFECKRQLDLPLQDWDVRTVLGGRDGSAMICAAPFVWIDALYAGAKSAGVRIRSIEPSLPYWLKKKKVIHGHFLLVSSECATIGQSMGDIVKSLSQRRLCGNESLQQLIDWARLETAGRRMSDAPVEILTIDARHPPVEGGDGGPVLGGEERTP